MISSGLSADLTGAPDSGAAINALYDGQKILHLHTLLRRNSFRKLDLTPRERDGLAPGELRYCDAGLSSLGKPPADPVITMKTPTMLSYPDCLFANSHGIMIGSGEVWFDEKSNGGLKIQAVNVPKP